MNILLVNGSLGGSTGNTAELLALAEEALNPHAKVETLELIRQPSMDRILAAVEQADGFIFGTGTYWDSWGSPMQIFLEMTAHTEGEAMWVGKPCGIIATAHAVGAKGIVSRLMGVLNVYGLVFPPFAGIAYTWANDVALPHASDHLRNELWTPRDVEVITHNVLEYLRGGKDWRHWPSNSGRYGEKWLYAYSQQVASE
jgi:hypothetical protein